MTPEDIFWLIFLILFTLASGWGFCYALIRAIRGDTPYDKLPPWLQ